MDEFSVTTVFDLLFLLRSQKSQWGEGGWWCCKGRLNIQSVLLLFALIPLVYLHILILLSPWPTPCTLCFLCAGFSAAHAERTNNSISLQSLQNRLCTPNSHAASRQVLKKWTALPPVFVFKWQVITPGIASHSLISTAEAVFVFSWLLKGMFGLNYKGFMCCLVNSLAKIPLLGAWSSFWRQVCKWKSTLWV